MSTMLRTTNPQAAERLSKPLIVPRQSEWVRFFPRPSEIRMGMTTMPALVLKSDQENALLDLLVVLDVDDMVRLNSIPVHIDSDRGWEALESQAQAFESEALRKLADFKDELADVLFGKDVDHTPSAPFLGMIEGLTSQYAALETRVKAMEDYLNSLPESAALPSPKASKRK